MRKTNSLPLLKQATDLAFRVHEKQIRKGSGIPYVNHLCEVTSRVTHYLWAVEGKSFEKALGMSKDEILSAAMLHDYIEDCNASFGTVKDKFGMNVAKVVLQCSRSANKEHKEGKYEFLESFHNKSLASVLIKIADRYCNVSDYYRTPEKKNYASTYALQAYPLYQAFYTMNKESDYNWSLAQEDVDSLQEIVDKVYNVKIFKQGQNDFIKELVT